MSSANLQLHRLDKRLIRQSFDAAAMRYDDVAVLQREVGHRLVDHLEPVKLSPGMILDIGAGTGYVSQALTMKYKGARILSLDIAPVMLQVARSKESWKDKWFGDRGYICGDAEYLPVADNSMDLIFSNLTVQWCGELDRVFAECKRVLKPGGLLMFSTFGPDTLKELRESWQKADIKNESVHVNDFLDMHDVGDALVRAGLSGPVMDVENFTLTYPDVYGLMRELKALGAHNVADNRRHSLTGKSRLKEMVAAYELYRANGVLPATYEVVYGHAWGVSDMQGVEVSLDTLTGAGMLR